MSTLGIDPGGSGGLAWVTGDPNEAFAMAMPDTERDIWEAISTRKPDFAIIEKVHSMPKQGVASSFKFGTSYGGLRMALIAAKIPFVWATPQVWQRGMHCLSGGDKNVTKKAAQELFPSLKITHVIADSLLIAEWGRRSIAPTGR